MISSQTPPPIPPHLLNPTPSPQPEERLKCVLTKVKELDRKFKQMGKELKPDNPLKNERIKEIQKHYKLLFPNKDKKQIKETLEKIDEINAKLRGLEAAPTPKWYQLFKTEADIKKETTHQKEELNKCRELITLQTSQLGELYPKMEHAWNQSLPELKLVALIRDNRIKSEEMYKRYQQEFAPYFKLPLSTEDRNSLENYLLQLSSAFETAQRVEKEWSSHVPFDELAIQTQNTSSSLVLKDLETIENNIHKTLDLSPMILYQPHESGPIGSSSAKKEAQKHFEDIKAQASKDLYKTLEILTDRDPLIPTPPLYLQLRKLTNPHLKNWIRQERSKMLHQLLTLQPPELKKYGFSSTSFEKLKNQVRTEGVLCLFNEDLIDAKKMDLMIIFIEREVTRLCFTPDSPTKKDDKNNLRILLEKMGERTNYSFVRNELFLNARARQAIARAGKELQLWDVPAHPPQNPLEIYEKISLWQFWPTNETPALGEAIQAQNMELREKIKCIFDVEKQFVHYLQDYKNMVHLLKEMNAITEKEQKGLCQDFAFKEQGPSDFQHYEEHLKQADKNLSQLFNLMIEFHLSQESDLYFEALKKIFNPDGVKKRETLFNETMHKQRALTGIKETLVFSGLHELSQQNTKLIENIKSRCNFTKDDEKALKQAEGEKPLYELIQDQNASNKYFGVKKFNDNIKKDGFIKQQQSMKDLIDYMSNPGLNLQKETGFLRVALRLFNHRLKAAGLITDRQRLPD